VSFDEASTLANMPVHTTYYDRKLRQGPALVRARRPYLYKNAATGLGLFAFVAGVYMYTIRAVGQDEFDDVKVPDAPKKL
jgi:cytochrome c oxidase assembly factor 3